jgi:predicted metal-dependent hydrolase
MILTVNGIEVQIVRKDIKNLHLGVYPPDGRVRVAVPKHVTDDNVRLAVISKLRWIKKQQQDFKEQPRQSERQYLSGECHYVFGKRYRLELIERDGKPEVKPLRSGKLQLFVRPGSSVEVKEKALNTWYREELKRAIPKLLEKWQPIVGKEASDWGIRKMKTKWGSCNIEQRRIWLNLQLVKKPPSCLEYILVHELVHLHERHHNEGFKLLMDSYLPNWRTCRDLLKREPLGKEDWIY